MEQFHALLVCTPTRYALLTGRYPIRNGFHIGVIKPWSDWGLPEEEKTLPEVLQERGYFTAIVGKWHLGHRRASFLPMNHGFDHQYGPFNGMIDYYAHRRGHALDWHRNQLTVHEKGYATELFSQEAVRLIENHDPSRPLFLYLPFTAPHTPMQAPQRYQRMYRHEKAPYRQMYSAMVTSLDDGVKTIVEALKRKGIFSNTLIIFLSDNGGDVDRGGSNFPLRGEKGTLYEGGVRVPAVMVWPGQIPAGGSLSTPTHMVDLFPTLSRLAGYDLKPQHQSRLDGVDLWPLVLGKAKADKREILLNLKREGGALLDGKWKLVVSKTGKKPLHAALFNLELDPSEQDDVSSSHPRITAHLLSRLDEYATQAAPARHLPKPLDWQPPAEW